MLVNANQAKFKISCVFKFNEKAIKWFRLYQSLNKMTVWPRWDYLKDKELIADRVEKSSDGFILWMRNSDNEYTGLSGFIEGDNIDLWHIDKRGLLKPCPHEFFIKVKNS